MSNQEWADRLAAYRRQGRSDADIARVRAHLERRGPSKPRSREQLAARSEGLGIVTRSIFAPEEEEDSYLTRDAKGLPTLRLVEAGDRLAIWSPKGDGALINPRGPGLRRFGLYSTPARGWNYNRSAYRAADLRRGRWVGLRRERNNPHDPTAVALSLDPPMSWG
jgi:hypothetical protein